MKAAPKDNRSARVFFDQSATHYGDEINRWFTSRRARFIQSFARGRVLEVGAGPGRLAQAYSPGELVASDISVNMLRQARSRLRAVELVACDAERLPFAADSFDTVVASELIYYLGEPAAFFRETRRILKPAGRLLLLWGARAFNALYPLAARLGLRPHDDLALVTPGRREVLDLLAAELEPRRVQVFGLGFPRPTRVLRPLAPIQGLVARM